MDIIDLDARRKARGISNAAPPPDDVLAAAELIRGYAKRLFVWSEGAHGAGDVVCANLCCLADCIEREVAPVATDRRDG